MTDASSLSKPLHGLRVLEFSTGSIAGQYCGQLLGDLGADVVRVDPAAAAEPFHHAAYNRNKRSLRLDPTTDAGRAQLRQLCLQADVLIDALPIGTLSRLGLNWMALADAAPRLVHVSIMQSASSATAAEQDRTDLMTEAAGGYMGLTGGRDGTPSRLGTSAFEMLTGMNCHAAILAALFQRAATGRGQHIEASVLESEIAFLVNAGMECMLGGPQPQRWGSEHAQQVPYKAFPTADGWLIVAAGFQKLYEAFVQALGRPDLVTDERFAILAGRVSHREALYAILDAETKRHGTAALLEQLEAGGVPCAPVNDLAQVFEHRQVRHHGMRIMLPGGAEVLGPATTYSAFAVTEDWTPPPSHGEHTAQVLRDWLAPAAL